VATAGPNRPIARQSEKAAQHFVDRTRSEKVPIAEVVSGQGDSETASEASLQPSRSVAVPSLSSTSTDRHALPPDEDSEYDSLPPPPFTPIGPSLDSPPFEEAIASASSSTSPRQEAQGTRPTMADSLHTQSSDDATMRAPSPVSLPGPRHAHSTPSVMSSSTTTTAGRVPARASTGSNGPQSGFNSMMAYKQPRPQSHFGTLHAPPHEHFDPTTLYRYASISSCLSGVALNGLQLSGLRTTEVPAVWEERHAFVCTSTVS
jgi:hypothetical protein